MIKKLVYRKITRVKIVPISMVEGKITPIN